MSRRRRRPRRAGDEEGLLERLRRGDEQAYLTLVERWHPAMVRLALGFVRDRATAEEVTQETWLHFVSGLERFEGRSSLRTWAFRILMNRARSRGVRERRCTPLSQLGEGAAADGPGMPSAASGSAEPGTGSPCWPPGSRSGAASPEEQLLAAELRRRVERAIRRLPERQRVVITLRDVQGWSAGEVCELLGVSDANQRILLHRARVRVREAVGRYFKRR